MTTERIASFDFQLAIWGYDSTGKHGVIDEIWERRDNSRISYNGTSLWDHGAGWLTNFWINDEPAPLWHALPYVAEFVRVAS
jgi:hypothetical protein